MSDAHLAAFAFARYALCRPSISRSASPFDDHRSHCHAWKGERCRHWPRSHSTDARRLPVKPINILRLAGTIALLCLAAANASAVQINVAVAANFTDAAKEIAASFHEKTG